MTGNRPPNPYVGPRAFKEEENRFFFGRDAEIEILAGLVLARRAALLFSPSGAGKSSLLRAGLIPELTRAETVGRGARAYTTRKMWGLPILSVAGAPESLPAPPANGYAYNALQGLLPDAAPADLAPLTLTGGLKLYHDARPIEETMAQTPRLLIFDQFEQLFTQPALHTADREDFFTQVRAALDADPLLHTLFSMREDYIAELTPYLALLPEQLRPRFRLEPLQREAAIQAMQRPAVLAGVVFSDEAARHLADDLSKGYVQRLDASADVQSGLAIEPVQLQVVCYRLWESLPEGATSITPAEVTRLGDVNHALGDYYAEQVRAVAAATGVSERAIRAWFADHLITPQGIRGQVLHDHAQSAGLVNRAIQGLVAAHLVQAEKRRGATWYELAHDRLIAPIRENNAEWRAANLRPWQTQAALWETQGRPRGFLLHGALLAEATAWAKIHPDLIMPDDHDFLAACREAQTQARRLRLLTLGVFIFGVLALGLAGVAWNRAQEANRQRDTAQRQSHIAQSRAMAAYAQSEPDQELAVLLGIEAVRQTQNDTPGMMTDEAVAALHQAMAQSRWQQTLRGHTGTIWEVVWSHDGTRLATGSQDKTARIWDGATGALFWTLAGHSRDVTHVAWSPDDRAMATAGMDSIVRVWNAAIGELTWTLSGHSGPINHIAWSSNGRWLASAGDDGTARIWDATTGVLLFTLTGHTDRVWDVEWSPDDTRLVTAGFDNTARVWDAQTGAPQWVFTNHTDRVWRAVWSHDGARIATASRDGTVKVWQLPVDNADKAMTVTTYSGHTGGVWDVAWSQDDAMLVTAGDDNTVRIWETATGRELRVLRGHTGSVVQAAWCASDTLIVTTGYDGAAKVWEAATGVEQLSLDGQLETVACNPLATRLATAGREGVVSLWDIATTADRFVLRGHDKAIQSAAWSPDSARIVTASGDGTVKVWDSTTGATLLTLRGHTGSVTDAAWDPSGAYLVTTGNDQTARVWDAISGTPLFTLTGHTDQVNQAIWDPAGTRLLTVSDDQTARIWDGRTGQPLHVLQGHTDAVWRGAWSAAGDRVATAGYDNTVKVWDIQTGKELTTLRGHINWVTSVAWSADGQRLLTASKDRTASVWDITTGKELLTLHGHTHDVNYAAWSPDEKYIATASHDNTAKIWDARTGKLLLTLSEHTGWVWYAAWSPDGALVATASEDKTVKVWDVATALAHKTETVTPLFTVWGHTDAVRLVAWSPDGVRLLSAGQDTTARITIARVDGPGGLIETACSRTGRNFTQEEWRRFMGTETPYRETCPGLPVGSK